MSLRIATYNIHKGVSGLGRRLRVHELRHALRSIDADIVFLQEVQDRNERLAARRKDYPDGRQVDFLASEHYEHSAYGMNAVYPHADLEREALQWAKEINGKSPTAQRMLKFAFNLVDDGLVGQQVFAGEATRLAYGTEEAAEGRDAFVQKRKRNFKKFPWTY